MTALNYKLFPEEIIVAMDTLATSPDDKLPYSYVTKFVILPHLKTVIAGTGHTGMLSFWFNHVNWDLNAQTIDQLDKITPNTLQKKIVNRNEKDLPSTTIYYFGYSEENNEHVGFRYRSIENWVSQKLPYSFGYKPEISKSIIEGLCNNGSGIKKFMIDLMIEQQKADNRLAISEKVGIGGDICLIYIKKEQIVTFPIYRFKSYDSDLALMPQGGSE